MSVAGATGASLAMPSDVQTGSLTNVFRNVDSVTLQIELAAASREIEGMATGRLLPFTVTEDTTSRNYDGLNRDLWVSERPELRSELWVGAVTSLMLFDRVISGGSYSVDVTTVDFDVTQGAVRFPDPLFQNLGYGGSGGGYSYGWGQPPTARARVTYTGGFPAGSVPEDLIQATAKQAAISRLNNLGDDDSKATAGDLEAQVEQIMSTWSVSRGARIG